MRDNVEDYDIVPANQDTGNRFDADNFYPFDGDVFSQEIGGDSEYSELFGWGKKEGGPGFFQGLKGAIGNIGGGKEERQRKRGVRQAGRKERRDARKDVRKARRDARQARKMQGLPGPVKSFFQKLSAKDSKFNAAAAKVQQGLGLSEDETLVDQGLILANKVMNGEIDEFDALNIDMGAGAVDFTKDVSDAEDEKAKGWKGLSMGVKVGIIGGGALVLGLGLYLILKKK